MNAPSLLNVDGVTKRFGKLVAVNNLNFTVNQHDILGLIGPNGSGKTTLMNLISGTLRLTSGEIRMGSKLISNMSPCQINRLGISHTYQLVKTLPSLTVLDNVMASGVFDFKKTWSAELRKEALILLERVGLGSLAFKQTIDLTPLDFRRLELAKALLGNPILLLLDEWLAGLDPSELHTAIELIHDLSREGRSIIIAEHTIDAVRSLCNRYVFMDKGFILDKNPVTPALNDHKLTHAYEGTP